MVAISLALFIFDEIMRPSVTIYVSEGARITLRYIGNGFLWSPYVIGQTIIFLPCSFFLLLSSSFFPRLISAVGDWMSTILLHMAWP